MKAVLVARDAAPSYAFKLLKPELERRGVEVADYLGEGKPLDSPPASILISVQRAANVVVSGMSSSNELAEPEIAACRAALAEGIPFGFYGDTYHCHERAREGAWFGEFREPAAFYFAINENEARAAKNVFPNALCVATGNPLWENFAFPKQNRAQVRQVFEIADDEFVILSPGGKSPVVNILVWSALI